METELLSAPETPRATQQTRAPLPKGMRPWPKGVSGNPSGRPKIEPRVRKFARRYDRRMCKVLCSIAEDSKHPVSERRKAAMDLIAVGSGRPATTQELVGKNGAPVGPLVNVNLNAQSSGPISPATAYRWMADGLIEADPQHFAGRVIEGSAGAEAQP